MRRLIILLLVAAGIAGSRIPYNANASHYVVCAIDETGSYTDIVTETKFKTLVKQNRVCAAYETDVDGLVEVDWEVVNGEVLIDKGE